MNYDALIRRANKLIDKYESRQHESSVHVITSEDKVDGLNGLVIILHPDTMALGNLATT